MNNENKKILIVEDDEDFLLILKKKLENENLSVFTAKNGYEGIEISKEEKPNLIITDILLPKIDGISMAKKIKESNNDIRVVFLSNIKEGTYIEEIKKNNFSHLIKSDISIGDIIKFIKEQLQ